MEKTCPKYATGSGPVSERWAAPTTVFAPVAATVSRAISVVVSSLAPAALPAAIATVLLASIAASLTNAQTKEQVDYQRRVGEIEQRIRDSSTREERAAAREELVAAFIAEADRLVQDTNYSSRSSGHYVVRTDDPNVSPGAVASLLDSFWSWFGEFWQGRLELGPPGEKGRVYLIYTFFKYNQLLTGDPEFGDFRPPGHYRPLFDVVVLQSGAVDPAVLPDVLVHEAAHQLINRRIGLGGGGPLWLEEGLASYFGYTMRNGDGRFETGRIGGKGTSLVNGAPEKGGGQARALLSRVKKLAKADVEWSLDDLLRLEDPRVFYDSAAQDRYAVSWLLVHFLFHGDDGAHAQGFADYLRHAAEGRGGTDMLYADLGLGQSALQASFADYVSKIRAK